MSQLLADPPLKPTPKRSRAHVMGASQLLLPLAIAAILVTAVVFRAWRLGSVPGLNGDEAWSGVQALRFLHGEPVAWRTPTGNPINVFFLGPEVLLHAVAKPSIALLRIVPLVSGLLALLVNYWFCRRVFDRSTAVISTLLLAALPINIAYSRFAWDASQSLLATLPVVYLSLLAAQRPERFARYLGFGVLALAAAVIVHPTNVFIAPMLVISAAFVKWDEIRSFVQRCRHETKLQTLLVGIGMVAIGAAWLGRNTLASKARLGSAQTLMLAFLYWLRLLSGSTIYRFISGSIDDYRFFDERYADLYDLAALVVVVAAVWCFIRHVRTQRDPCDRALAYGVAAVFLGFYVVAGLRALEPHFERYAICLIAPSILMISRGLATCEWIPFRLRKKVSLWGTMAISTALLIGFYVNYLQEFAVSGGNSHRAFHTGTIDPKQQAVEYLLERQVPGKTTWIVAHEWWTYWPAAYFAYGAPDLKVVERYDQISPATNLASIWDLQFTPYMKRYCEVNSAWNRLNRRPYDESVEFDGARGTPVITIFRRETKNFPE